MAAAAMIVSMNVVSRSTNRAAVFGSLGDQTSMYMVA